MRKVIVILLVLGLLLGTCCIAADTSEEEPFSDPDLLGDPGTGDGPAPCGGGSGNGGGAPG